MEVVGVLVSPLQAATDTGLWDTAAEDGFILEDRCVSDVDDNLGCKLFVDIGREGKVLFGFSFSLSSLLKGGKTALAVELVCRFEVAMVILCS